MFFYNIAFVNSQRSLAKRHYKTVDQQGKLYLTFLNITVFFPKLQTHILTNIHILGDRLRRQEKGAKVQPVQINRVLYNSLSKT